MKECPVCTETMRLVVRERAERLPGRAQLTTRQVREWVCVECDYFEEAEDSAS